MPRKRRRCRRLAAVTCKKVQAKSLNIDKKSDEEPIQSTANDLNMPCDPDTELSPSHNLNCNKSLRRSSRIIQKDLKMSPTTGRDSSVLIEEKEYVVATHSMSSTQSAKNVEVSDTISDQEDCSNTPVSFITARNIRCTKSPERNLHSSEPPASIEKLDDNSSTEKNGEANYDEIDLGQMSDADEDQLIYDGEDLDKISEEENDDVLMIQDSGDEIFADEHPTNDLIEGIKDANDINAEKSEDFVEHLEPSKVPGSSFLLCIKDKGKVVIVECLLCSCALEGKDIIAHITMRDHLLNVLKLESYSNYTKYCEDISTSAAQLLKLVLNLESTLPRQKMKTIGPSNYSTEKKLLLARLLKLMYISSKKTLTEVNEGETEINYLGKFNRIAVIGSVQFADLLKKLTIEGVAVYIVDMNFSELKTFIQTVKKDHPSNTLWLLFIGAHNIAQITNMDECLPTNCKTPLKKIMFLEDCQTLTSIKNMSEKICVLLNSTIRKVKKSLHKESDFTIMTPIPLEIIKMDSLDSHEILHFQQKSHPYCFRAEEEVADVMERSYPLFCEDVTRAILASMPCERKSHPLFLFNELHSLHFQCIAKHSQSNFFDLWGNHLVQVFKSLMKKPAILHPLDSQFRLVPKLTYSSYASNVEEKSFDHVILIGNRLLIRRVSAYDSRLKGCSLVDWELFSNWNILRETVKKIKALCQRVFVLILCDASIIGKQMTYMHCLSNQCKDPIYLQTINGPPQCNIRIAENLKCVEKLGHELKKLGILDTVILPLLPAYFINNAAVTEEIFHIIMHTVCPEFANFVDGSQSEWTSATTLLCPKWNNMVLETFRDNYLNLETLDSAWYDQVNLVHWNDPNLVSLKVPSKSQDQWKASFLDFLERNFFNRFEFMNIDESSSSTSCGNVALASTQFEKCHHYSSIRLLIQSSLQNYATTEKKNNSLGQVSQTLNSPTNISPETPLIIGLPNLSSSVLTANQAQQNDVVASLENFVGNNEFKQFYIVGDAKTAILLNTRPYTVRFINYDLKDADCDAAKIIRRNFGQLRGRHVCCFLVINLSLITMEAEAHSIKCSKADCSPELKCLDIKSPSRASMTVLEQIVARIKVIGDLVDELSKTIPTFILPLCPSIVFCCPDDSVINYEIAHQISKPTLSLVLGHEGFWKECYLHLKNTWNDFLFHNHMNNHLNSRKVAEKYIDDNHELHLFGTSYDDSQTKWTEENIWKDYCEAFFRVMVQKNINEPGRNNAAASSQNGSCANYKEKSAIQGYPHPVAPQFYQPMQLRQTSPQFYSMAPFHLSPYCNVPINKAYMDNSPSQANSTFGNPNYPNYPPPSMFPPGWSQPKCYPPQNVSTEGYPSQTLSKVPTAVAQEESYPPQTLSTVPTAAVQEGSYPPQALSTVPPAITQAESYLPQTFSTMPPAVAQPVSYTRKTFSAMPPAVSQAKSNPPQTFSALPPAVTQPVSYAPKTFSAMPPAVSQSKSYPPKTISTVPPAVTQPVSYTLKTFSAMPPVVSQAKSYPPKTISTVPPAVTQPVSYTRKTFSAMPPVVSQAKSNEPQTFSMTHSFQSSVKNDNSIPVYGVNVVIENASDLIPPQLFKGISHAIESNSIAEQKEGKIIMKFKVLSGAQHIVQLLNNLRIADSILTASIPNESTSKWMAVVDISYIQPIYRTIYLQFKHQIIRNSMKLIENTIHVASFKTKLCEKKCDDVSLCMNYHGTEDKRRNPIWVSYSMTMCCSTMKASTVQCPNGVRCYCSHNLFEQIYHPKSFKTVCCGYGAQRVCPRMPFCHFYHKDSPDAFFTADWKDAVVFGFQNSFTYLVGAINGLNKISDFKDGKILFISTDADFISVVEASILAMLKCCGMAALNLGVPINFKEGASYHVISGSASKISTNKIVKGSISAIIVDDIGLILRTPSERGALQQIFHTLRLQGQTFARVNKVFVADKRDDPKITEVISQYLTLDLITISPEIDVSQNTASGSFCEASQTASEAAPEVITERDDGSMEVVFDGTSSNSRIKRRSRSTSSSDRSPVRKKSRSRDSRKRSRTPHRRRRSRSRPRRESRARSRSRPRKESKARSRSRPRKESKARSRSRPRKESRARSRSRPRREWKARSRSRLRSRTPPPSGARSSSSSLPPPMDKSLGSLLKIRQHEEAVRTQIDDDFKVFEEVPEIHQEYEEHYLSFLGDYVKHFPGLNNEQHQESLWLEHWRAALKSIKLKETQKRLNEIRERASEDESLKVHNLSSPKEVDTFSVAKTLDIVTQLEGNLGVLKPAINALINEYNAKGSGTTTALMTFNNPEAIMLMKIVLEKFETCAAAASAMMRPVYTTAVDWIGRLLSLVNEPPITTSKNLTLNTENIARGTLGKDCNYILDVIKNALAYEGIKNPPREQVNALYLEICSLQLRMSMDS